MDGLAVVVSYDAQLLVRVSSGSPGKYGSGSACSDVFRQSRRGELLYAIVRWLLGGRVSVLLAVEYRATVSQAIVKKTAKRGAVKQYPSFFMKTQIPIWEKTHLTLEEAAAYTGIGINKLRQLTNDRHCPFVLFVGTKRLIKRKKIDEYLENSYSI